MKHLLDKKRTITGPKRSKKSVHCTRYDSCSAPLCPLDEGSLRYGVWYVDEPVCRSKEEKAAHWIQVQRRIQQRTTTTDIGCFTHDMLCLVERVRTGITGVHPRGNLEKCVERWKKRRFRSSQAQDEKTCVRPPFDTHIIEGISLPEKGSHPVIPGLRTVLRALTAVQNE